MSEFGICFFKFQWWWFSGVGLGRKFALGSISCSFEWQLQTRICLTNSQIKKNEKVSWDFCFSNFLFIFNKIVRSNFEYFLHEFAFISLQLNLNLIQLNNTNPIEFELNLIIWIQFHSSCMQCYSKKKFKSNLISTKSIH
jgi:hypothetical protein